MIIRKTEHTSDNDNPIVLIKRTEKGSFVPYEEITDDSGAVEYRLHDDLRIICNLSATSKSSTTDDFISRVDMLKVAEKIGDSLAVSKHYIAERSTAKADWSTSTTLVFWRKQADKWSKTARIPITDNSVKVLNAVVAHQFSAEGKEEAHKRLTEVQ
jgi:hypothetical protein